MLFTGEEKKAFLREEPGAKPYFRRLMGSVEFINSIDRWCLWLLDADPAELKALKNVRKRLERVKEARLESDRPTTKRLAETPALFGEIRQPTKRYLAVPEVSSENRFFIPIGFLPAAVIATNKLYTIDGAGELELGLLCSTMHMGWTRAVSGRLKSDFQYSAGIVYNNFPWPEAPTEKQRGAIEEGARGVLAAREEFPDSTLADLYDPLTMPPVLVKAHARLDKAVDAAYGYKGKPTDAERVAFLFELCQKYTSLFVSGKTDKPRKR